MLVTEFGIVIVFRLQQPSNAQLPMVVTPFGIVMLSVLPVDTPKSSLPMFANALLAYFCIVIRDCNALKERATPRT